MANCAHSSGTRSFWCAEVGGMTTGLGRKAQVESQFSRAADMYAVSEHRAGSDLDALIEFAEPVSDDVVLDVATGAGHVALALAPLVSSVPVASHTSGGLALFAECVTCGMTSRSTNEVH